MFLNEINFANLKNLNLIIILFISINLILLFKLYKFIKAIKSILNTNKNYNNFKSNRIFKESCKTFLLSAAIFFFCIALLQPKKDGKTNNVKQEGRDLLIALDVSRSMLAEDCTPSRLEAAKNKIKKLLYNLSCERVGLIIFSGNSFLQCPLTKDFAAFSMFLDQISTEAITSGTTALSKPIKQALNIFKELPDKKTKLLCLFTDGEDFSTDTESIKEQAQKENLSIFSVGLGSKNGAPIPIIDSNKKKIGFEKDQNNQIIMSKCNESLLKNLTETCGGKFIKATTDDTDIANLIKEVLKFEKDSFEDKEIIEFEHKYYYFLFISFIFFIIEWII